MLFKRELTAPESCFCFVFQLFVLRSQAKTKSVLYIFCSSLGLAMVPIFTTIALQLTSTDNVFLNWDLLFVFLYYLTIFLPQDLFLLYFKTRAHVILLSLAD